MGRKTVPRGTRTRREGGAAPPSSLRNATNGARSRQTGTARSALAANGEASGSPANGLSLASAARPEISTSNGHAADPAASAVPVPSAASPEALPDTTSTSTASPADDAAADGALDVGARVPEPGATSAEASASPDAPALDALEGRSAWRAIAAAPTGSTVVEPPSRPERLYPAPPADREDGPGLFATLGVWLSGRVREFVPWVRGLSRESWAWIGIIVLATVLRFWGLGDKPLHHDESMHAYYSLYFALHPESYWYDPLLHGPFQFHAEAFVLNVILRFASLLHVATASGDPWINDTTARILPATTGVVLVGLTYGLRRDLGRIGALVAAFLLAVSPSFVYFSRFLREDIYFTCFSYATVVFAIQFARRRTTPWLVATVAAFILAYATKEAIYLNTIVWVSFLVLLAVWELGHWVSARLPRLLTARERAFFGHAAPVLLLGAVGSAVAGIGLHKVNQLSAQINSHTAQTDIQVARLENTTVTIVLWGSIVLALLVIGVLVKQIYFGGDDSALMTSHHIDDAESGVDDVRYLRLRGGLAGLAERLNPERQPFLRLMLSISWVSWFVAFVVGWVLFAALYWIVPSANSPYGVTNIAQGFQVGVGRGIWQGLYYWLQQQQVARGGQPWYYYLLLIPLYEQLAVVFGLAGVVLALARPTRFRLFLVYWFVVSLALYSWASEKMPWLSIHIVLPLMLLAAVTLEALIRNAVVMYRRRAAEGWTPRDPLDAARRVAAESWATVRSGWPGVRAAGVVVGLMGAVVLLIPMLYGMLVLTHPDAANGPHEMMVYVQTTPDVQRVMDKLAQADAKLYGGQHRLKIMVGQGEEWPFRSPVPPRRKKTSCCSRRMTPPVSWRPTHTPILPRPISCARGGTKAISHRRAYPAPGSPARVRRRFGLASA